jgi:hypothetical protein
LFNFKEKMIIERFSLSIFRWECCL